LKDKHSDILFKQRKNKTFKYKSRFSEKDKQKADSDELEARDFISKWRSEHGNSRKVISGGTSVKILIFFLVLLLICMYLIEKKYM
jgi:hypothetical protein